MEIVEKEDEWVKPECPLIGCDWRIEARSVAEFAEAYTDLHMLMSNGL